jgi:hypothetical protein
MLSEFTFNHCHLFPRASRLRKNQAICLFSGRAAPKWGVLAELISRTVTVPELNFINA